MADQAGAAIVLFFQFAAEHFDQGTRLALGGYLGLAFGILLADLLHPLRASQLIQALVLDPGVAFFRLLVFLGQPVQEVEAGRKRSLDTAGGIKAVKDNSYASLPGTDVFSLSRRGKTDAQAIEQLTIFLNRYENAILRLSLQRTSPHLILRARLAPVMAEPLAEFLAALQAALT
mgnify:CR=1 FL=1